MLHSAWKYRNSSIWTGFLPALFLNCILNILLMICATKVHAQVANHEPTSAQISGAVFLEVNNRPAGQVIVSLRSETAGISRSVLTDYDGKFEVRGLAPGIYEIGVEETGYEPARIRTELKDALSKLVLKLKPVHASTADRGDYTVSVAQLKVPEKAHDEFKKGLERLAKNDPEGSLSHLKKAIAVYPNYSEAYYHLGVVQAKVGRVPEALNAFYKAIDLSGGSYAWAEFGVGFVLCQQGKLGEAEAIIRKGLEMDKDSPEGHVVLGIALLRLNRVNEAELSAHEALLRNTNYPEAHLVLADVYARRRSYRAQLEELDTYLKLQPGGAERESVHRAREVALKNIAKLDEEH